MDATNAQLFPRVPTKSILTLIFLGFLCRDGPVQLPILPFPLTSLLIFVLFCFRAEWQNASDVPSSFLHTSSVTGTQVFHAPPSHFLGYLSPTTSLKSPLTVSYSPPNFLHLPPFSFLQLRAGSSFLNFIRRTRARTHAHPALLLWRFLTRSQQAGASRLERLRGSTDAHL